MDVGWGLLEHGMWVGDCLNMGSLAGGGDPFKNKPVNIIVKKTEINRLIHGKFIK
jgi:hypothetical protein